MYLRSNRFSVHTAAVPTEWRYRGREIGSSEVAFLRELIRDCPELSRYALSKKVCEAWQWKQANGELRDMVCRGLLLMLDRAGAIQLPPHGALRGTGQRDVTAPNL
jgi:hypothetical protein